MQQELVVNSVNLASSLMTQTDARNALLVNLQHNLVLPNVILVVVVEKEMQLELAVIIVILVNLLQEKVLAKAVHSILFLIYLALVNVKNVEQVLNQILQELVVNCVNLVSSLQMLIDANFAL